MAENTDATLEENKQLREAIAEVQIERRRKAAEADGVREEVLARQENQRLREVYDSQVALLDADTKAVETAGKPTTSRAQVPYTITKDGPVYSTPNHGEQKPKAEEVQARSAPTPPLPPSFGASNADDSGADDDDDKEN